MSLSSILCELRKQWLVGLCAVLMCASAFAQSELAALLGRVTDQSGAAIVGAQIQIRNVETNVVLMTTTNGEGLYSLPSIHPGHYVVSAIKSGFRTVSVTGMEINVQDNIVRNFILQVGSTSESVTVTADTTKINTVDGTVSTVIDRNFAENLPMNGRSFQTLIQLTPGVVVTASSLDDSGQFSVNGQRPSSNYWTVDGVSANFGISTDVGPGNGFGGTLGSFSAQGGTNSLVSVDALQEFRIQTSTFAPEFGRTPGAQISIVTRSGTNKLHGSAFDYLRNDALDASDWFNGFENTPPLPKSAERQNDFGVVLGGPLLKDRSFFFFSYEGLRLRLPRTALTMVPDLSARQAASPDLAPFLSAFPKPNGPEILDSQGQPTGTAEFDSGYSNKSTLDATSLRIDHRLSDRLLIFGRYDYSPSQISLRQIGGNNSPINNLLISNINTQTATLGLTFDSSSHVVNELRLNFSRAKSSGQFTQDDFGGATPLAAVPFPSPFTSHDARFTFTIFGLRGGQYVLGNDATNVQRQWNVVDSVTLQSGTHTIKIGGDYRRLAPTSDPFQYGQAPFFSNVASAETGTLLASLLTSGQRTDALLQNLGLFMQDTWRTSQRLSLTYGLRWDVDFAPRTNNGPGFPALSGYDLNNLSNLALLPVGTSPFATRYNNFAPRIGLAYQLSGDQGKMTVLRGGFGLFYDLVDSQLAEGIDSTTYPFGASSIKFGGTFPLSSSTASPPAIVPPSGGAGTVSGFDPNLKLPYTLQWNVAVEQAVGVNQSLSVSYIGAAGRRLIQSADVLSPNSTFGAALLIGNTAVSDYNALQTQFQKRMSHNLQALVSYTWSHSIDTASEGSIFGNEANALVPGVDPAINRGPSDFDVRNALSGAAVYSVPNHFSNRVVTAISHGWSLENVVQARSALPLTVFDSEFSDLANASAAVRPDLIPGIPVYSYGHQFPGGKALNNLAGVGGPGCSGPFCPPPTDSNGVPLRQGNLGRNSLRGLPAWQWDFAVHRDFVIREPFHLQFRAEMFNVLNHPNFAPLVSDLSDPQFGQSTQMLSQGLGSNVGNGGFDSLYQMGGPRSIQLALKMLF